MIYKPVIIPTTGRTKLVFYVKCYLRLEAFSIQMIKVFLEICCGLQCKLYIHSLYMIILKSS